MTERETMDSSSELAKAKWLLIAILIFFVSLYLCYAEAAYLLSGRETQANVTSVYEVTKRGRFGLNRGTNLRIEYAFNEPDGTRRTDSFTTSTGSFARAAQHGMAPPYSSGNDGQACPIIPVT